MRVYIRFVKLDDKGMSRASVAAFAQVLGAYTSASLVILESGSKASSFGTSLLGGYFEETPFTGNFPSPVTPVQPGHHFMLMSTTDEEADRIMRTCRGCVRAKKLFNLRDWVLYHVPFREPAEITLFEARTLNDTQSVILVLRECLSTQNDLFQTLSSLHSRTTTASALYDAIALHFNKDDKTATGKSERATAGLQQET